MTVKTRIEPIDRDVDLAISELLSPQARRLAFAEQAQVFLDDADATNRQGLGRVPKSKTYVDGREGAPLDSVKLPGVIVREYELVDDVLDFISDSLITISPVGHGPDKRPGHPGFYKASHALFADGAEVTWGKPVPPAQEYVFLNTAPYARKIDQQWAVYEFTANKAAARFGNVASIRFSWRSPVLSYVAGGVNREQRAAERNKPAKQSAKRMERETRVPAIIVKLG